MPLHAVYLSEEELAKLVELVEFHQQRCNYNDTVAGIWFKAMDVVGTLLVAPYNEELEYLHGPDEAAGYE